MTGSLLHKIFSTPALSRSHLGSLVEKCLQVGSMEEKLEILNAEEEVIKFFTDHSLLRSFLFGLSSECEVVIKSVVAIGQGERIFCDITIEGVRHLLMQLLPVEHFYRDVGGIIGYQCIMQQLLTREDAVQSRNERYLRPEGVAINQYTAEVQQAILSGIASLPHFAEMYPVGGAADRLAFFDEATGEPLPAAALPFLGKTLLEGLVRDVQAREYLYFKLFGKQCTTPIAMMTSHEKNNHQRIRAICEDNHWFGRSRESFRFFIQPSVPTVNREGLWCLEGPMDLLLKPGGHGVIWKLAKDEGVFNWLYGLGRSKAVVRQINNPIAGIDYGMTAFVGWGWEHQKLFGFASCPRPLKVQEGMNVLIERPIASGVQYVLTNIEYSEFQKFNHLDAPLEPGSAFSQFSSNTNLLFIDLKAVEEAIMRSPVPGKIVNFKKATFRSETGDVKEEVVARVESTMQNIADVFSEDFSQPLQEGKRDCLKTFISYHDRKKTISSVKRSYQPGGALAETPEGAFLDYIANMHELLTRHCGMDLKGVFHCVIHPALGPFFSIIGQKIRGGKLADGADLQLDIVDLKIDNLDLDGSLLIQANSPMGHVGNEGVLTYSNCTGKCTLRNVRVKNRGLDTKAQNVSWKNAMHYHERCAIVIEGCGEFEAESVVFEGNVRIHVKDGYRLVVSEVEGQIVTREEKIESPTWGWKYQVIECGLRPHSITLSTE